jgi:hypothetical protein
MYLNTYAEIIGNETLTTFPFRRIKHLRCLSTAKIGPSTVFAPALQQPFAARGESLHFCKSEMGETGEACRTVRVAKGPFFLE